MQRKRHSLPLTGASEAAAQQQQQQPGSRRSLAPSSLGLLGKTSKAAVTLRHTSSGWTAFAEHRRTAHHFVDPPGESLLALASASGVPAECHYEQVLPRQLDVRDSDTHAC